jgi:hypothetical protein
MSNIDLSQIVTAEDKAAREQAWRRGGVNAERDLRLAAGTTITVAGYGDIPVQGRPSDQINMIALESTAKDMAAAGITSAAIPFRDAENTMHDLTPDQVIDMVSKAKQAATAIYAAAWELKDGAGVPADYTDDKHWP